MVFFCNILYNLNCLSKHVAGVETTGQPCLQAEPCNQMFTTTLNICTRCSQPPPTSGPTIVPPCTQHLDQPLLYPHVELGLASWAVIVRPHRSHVSRCSQPHQPAGLSIVIQHISRQGKGHFFTQADLFNPKFNQKSCIQETKHISTDAESSTDTKKSC